MCCPWSCGSPLSVCRGLPFSIATLGFMSCIIRGCNTRVQVMHHARTNKAKGRKQRARQGRRQGQHGPCELKGKKTPELGCQPAVLQQILWQQRWRPALLRSDAGHRGQGVAPALPPAVIPGQVVTCGALHRLGFPQACKDVCIGKDVCAGKEAAAGTVVAVQGHPTCLAFPGPARGARGRACVELCHAGRRRDRPRRLGRTQRGHQRSIPHSLYNSIRPERAPDTSCSYSPLNSRGASTSRCLTAVSEEQARQAALKAARSQGPGQGGAGQEVGVRAAAKKSAARGAGASGGLEGPGAGQD